MRFANGVSSFVLFLLFALCFFTFLRNFVIFHKRRKQHNCGRRSRRILARARLRSGLSFFAALVFGVACALTTFDLSIPRNASNLRTDEGASIQRESRGGVYFLTTAAETRSSIRPRVAFMPFIPAKVSEFPENDVL